MFQVRRPYTQCFFRIIPVTAQQPTIAARHRDTSTATFSVSPVAGVVPGFAGSVGFEGSAGFSGSVGLEGSVGTVGSLSFLIYTSVMS